jgi:hypothetical protein
MVMGVTSLDQTFHLLAYAVVNKEDTEGHEHCLRMLKEGIELEVNKCAEEGEDI